MMEEDPLFKQIIPYVVVLNNKDEILTYKRSTKSGEDRLHNMYSIGVGGHIDINTTERDSLTSDEIFFNSMIREISEELGIRTYDFEYDIKATIYDPSNDVGKVHFGVVAFLRVDSDISLNDGETDIITEREFLSLEELSKRYESLENWSKIIIDNKGSIFKKDENTEEENTETIISDSNPDTEYLPMRKTHIVEENGILKIYVTYGDDDIRVYQLDENDVITRCK